MLYRHHNDQPLSFAPPTAANVEGRQFAPRRVRVVPKSPLKPSTSTKLLHEDRDHAEFRQDAEAFAPRRQGERFVLSTGASRRPPGTAHAPAPPPGQRSFLGIARRAKPSPKEKPNADIDRILYVP